MIKIKIRLKISNVHVDVVFHFKNITGYPELIVTGVPNRKCVYY